MPRITINVTQAQLDRLAQLNRALNERARRLDSESKSCALEGTAMLAIEYGLQELSKVWYRTELVLQHAAEAPAQSVRDGVLLGDWPCVPDQAHPFQVWP